MIVWIDAAAAATTPKVFGLGLIERHLHAIAGVRPAPSRVIVDLGLHHAVPHLPEQLRRRLPLEWQRAAEPYAARLGRILATSDGHAVLILDGATLVDPRLHATLTAGQVSQVVLSRDPQDRAAALLLAADPGLLDDTLATEPHDIWQLATQLTESGRVPALREDAFKGFVRRLRRTLPYYLFRIAGPERAARVERFLFWSNYKGSTDLFTRYVYPPLVWLLVRPLAHWRIHPNWVTLLSIVLALGAVPLWANGSFIIGFIMAYAMSVLDSVDGKLARLTFTDSELGNLMDHGLDMVHPPLWYLAWAYGLGVNVDGWGSSLGLAAIAIVGLYAIDRLVLKIYPRVFKRAFHTHSRMDGLVRSFIARRNISLPLFTIGFLLGQGRRAFYLIVAWQAATTLYHAGRTFWILAVEKAHRKEHAPVEVASKTLRLD